MIFMCFPCGFPSFSAENTSKLGVSICPSGSGANGRNPHEAGGVDEVGAAAIASFHPFSTRFPPLFHRFFSRFSSVFYVFCCVFHRFSMFFLGFSHVFRGFVAQNLGFFIVFEAKSASEACRAAISRLVVGHPIHLQGSEA